MAPLWTSAFIRTERYIKHPLEAVSVGDVVEVQVMTVDVDRRRIQLTMKIGR